MAKKATLQAEVEALRTELNALRDEKPSSAKSAEETKPRSDEETADAPRPEELLDDEQPTAADIEKAIDDFVHSVKDEVNERPMVAVGLAFALGILIGRLSRS